MSDVPYFDVPSVEKNVLESPSATSSCDFLLKETPPFWLQRLWQAYRKIISQPVADFRRWMRVRTTRKTSELITFIRPLILFTLYLRKLHFPKNNRIRLIAIAESPVLKKAYFSEDFHPTENWTPSPHRSTVEEEKVKMTISGCMRDSPHHQLRKNCRSLPVALQSTLHPLNVIR